MKRLISCIAAFMLAVSIVIPATAVESDAAFSARTSLPSYDSSAGKAYYYSDNNVFYATGYGPDRVKRSDGKYVTGNCTWYAYGRASEILGKKLNTNFRWSASKWWDTNKQGNYYPYGSEPKVGAIACYSSHVAIVEKVVNGKPYVSESSWTLSGSKPTSASKLKFHYGTPWSDSLKGYIYITDEASTGSSSDEVKDVDYSVKITAKDLNMRTGPGTEYSRIGYVKQGTYEVSQECGNWARLADSGYWVCMTYVKKVSGSSGSSDTVVSTGTAANYSVKIKAVNLNMRLGPGTDYKRVSYINPGTYTIIQTSGNWGKVKETGYWVCLTYTTKVSAASSGNAAASSGKYDVEINTLALRMRTGPGTEYSMKGLLLMGKQVTIKANKNGWGQLEENGYWIKLSYTVPVDGEYNVKVTAKDLNMRTGPGILYSRKGYIKPGVHTIVKTDGGWGKVKSNGYWIKLSYTKRI